MIEEAQAQAAPASLVTSASVSQQQLTSRSLQDHVTYDTAHARTCISSHSECTHTVADLECIAYRDCLVVVHHRRVIKPFHRILIHLHYTQSPFAQCHTVSTGSCQIQCTIQSRIQRIQARYLFHKSNVLIRKLMCTFEHERASKF